MGYDMYLERKDLTAPAEGSGIARTYFRYNIWGMRTMRQIMQALDLVDLTPATYDELLPKDKRPNLMLFSPPGADPDDWYWTGESKSDPRWQEFHRRDLAWRGPESPSGLPYLAKFGSNDGWWVRPEECARMVAKYYALTPDDVTKALEAISEDSDAEWVQGWRKELEDWMAWNAAAASENGYTVS